MNAAVASGYAARVESELGFAEQRLLRVLHDLRNPLAVVLSNVELVLDDRGVDPGNREALDDARSAARRILRQINNLLDTTRIESGTAQIPIERVGVAELLSAAAAEVSPCAQADVALEIAVAPTVAALGNQQMLVRVIGNLLDNAFRYARSPGGKVLMRGSTHGRHVRIEVANDGQPIVAAERARLFERPRGDAPPSIPNRDLGLYYCRLALEALGGRIWLEEDADFPATFVLELPAAGAPPAVNS